MRSLRSSLASNNLSINQSISSTRAVKNSQVVTAYTAVPKQRLNLVESQFSKTKAGEGDFKPKYKKYYENSKERKRRLWKERQEKWKGETNEARERFSDWMYLPDLILEHIFKFLSYKGRLHAPFLAAIGFGFSGAQV